MRGEVFNDIGAHAVSLHSRHTQQTDTQAHIDRQRETDTQLPH